MLKNAIKPITKILKKLKKKSKKYKPRDRFELRELILNPNINLYDIDVSKVRNMKGVFVACKRDSYEGIETWDVSRVYSMESMFCNSNFNGDISN